ncbi:hypothetical protein GCM10017786_36670 [Amycolatopsis deserti]|uniref:Uncharacterized protein n=1 Tax=Amycolatopsis deserti TaxID=185696 RepID=A0ABQ3J141_9PSEU|nr:hypothetical protein GCM10017786_36670 [Amycolatopsis deserti]
MPAVVDDGHVHRLPDLLAFAREHDWNSLMATASPVSCVEVAAAGERLDPETYQWASASLSVPVVDHWWQTETG